MGGWPRGRPRSENTKRAIAQALRARHANLRRADRLVEASRGLVKVALMAGKDASIAGALHHLNEALELVGEEPVWPEPGSADTYQDRLMNAFEEALGRYEANLVLGPKLAEGQPARAKSATRTVLRKSAPASYKAKPSGRVEAIVSVFGNVDVMGDRVMPGAFAGSLGRWRESGDPIPVVFSHDWGDPFSHIGAVERATETEKGLRVEYALDVKENPKAAQVYDLLRKRRIREHSFAYDVIESRPAEDGANELVELDLIEVGPTLKGANPETELLGVKNARASHDPQRVLDRIASLKGQRPAPSSSPPREGLNRGSLSAPAGRGALTVDAEPDPEPRIRFDQRRDRWVFEDGS